VVCNSYAASEGIKAANNTTTDLGSNGCLPHDGIIGDTMSIGLGKFLLFLILLHQS
jgi:hypothetical protein